MLGDLFSFYSLELGDVITSIWSEPLMMGQPDGGMFELLKGEHLVVWALTVSGAYLEGYVSADSATLMHVSGQKVILYSRSWLGRYPSNYFKRSE